VLGPLARPSPKREGGNEPGAGSILISHDHALHNPAYPSTTAICVFRRTGLKALRGHPRPYRGDLRRILHVSFSEHPF